MMIVARDPNNPDGCMNCGRTIGKLETTFLWRENIVCRDCHERLSRQSVIPSARPQANDRDAKDSPKCCPRCGSENVISVPLAFRNGTTTSVMAGFATGAADQIFAGESVSQSLLARSITPPKKKPEAVPAVAMFIFWVSAVLCAGYWIINAKSPNETDRDSAIISLAGAIVLVLLGLGCFWALRSAARFNKFDWVALTRNWQSSWHCNKCGMIFKS